MEPPVKPGPSVLVIFGAAGDLTWRKLVPALYNLYLDRWLPDRFCVIGIDVKEMSEAEFRMRLRQGVNRFSRRGPVNTEAWAGFEKMLTFIRADFANSSLYADLGKRLGDLDRMWNSQAEEIFYLAVPPRLVQGIAEQLTKAGLSRDREHERLVVEKPFGRDLSTAREINRVVTNLFQECQIYRIDHYLGKETVQNILAFRFANALFEPLWNRRYIDSIQITVAESIGVEHRGSYYEKAGALRDMVQNHLLQVLSLVTMEPPVSLDADEFRNKAVDVLHAIRVLEPDHVADCAVRGQYGAGWIQGEHVPAYRAEPDVAPDSNAETYAAVRLHIDNWRWQDVPVYLRTGKRLPVKVSEVSIQFQPVPHRAFPSSCLQDWEPNRLAVRIQPEEGILLRCHAKLPGPIMRLSTVDLQFSYQRAFKAEPPEAYENLLLDVMRGDATLFMRADQVEAAWSIVTPILEVWETMPLQDSNFYPAGTWGPEAANALIAADGRHWLIPTAAELGEKEEPNSEPRVRLSH